MVLCFEKNFDKDGIHWISFHLSAGQCSWKILVDTRYHSLDNNIFSIGNERYDQYWEMKDMYNIENEGYVHYWKLVEKCFHVQMGQYMNIMDSNLVLYAISDAGHFNTIPQHMCFIFRFATEFSLYWMTVLVQTKMISHQCTHSFQT